MAMRLYAGEGPVPDSGKYIEFLYTVKGNEYMMGTRMNFVGMRDVMDPGTKYLLFTWNENLNRQEKSVKMERMNSTIYYKFLGEKVDYIAETKNEEKYLKNELARW